MGPIIIKLLLLALVEVWGVVGVDPHVLSLFLEPPGPYNSIVTHSSQPIFNSKTTESAQESHRHDEINPVSQSGQLVDHRTAQESNYGQQQQQTFYRPPQYQAPLVSPHPTHFQHHPNYHTLVPFNSQPHQNHHHHQGQRQQGHHHQTNHYGPPLQPSTRTIKYVSVFVAPPDPIYTQPQRIKINGEAEKQVNIIFIKNPASQNGHTAEVDLPPLPEQKTLVYVLNEKRTADQNIKVNTPHQPKHHKPDVFFVQYKNPGQHQHNPHHHHNNNHHPQNQYGTPNLYSGNGQPNGHQNNFNYYSSSSQATTIARNKDTVSSYSDSNESTYAPTMSHETYNVLSKREIADKGNSTSDSTSSSGGSNYDFRPYRYGVNYGHNYYGVINPNHSH